MKLKRRKLSPAAQQRRQAELAASRDTLRQAFALFQAGLLDEAEAQYQQVLRQAPEQAEACHFLGAIALLRGDPATAVPYLARSLKINPNNPDGYNNLGYALLATGETAKAIAALEQALAQRADHAEALNNLGNARQVTGDLAAAEECYRKAVAAQPGMAKAYYNLGTIYQLDHRPDEAITAYRQALALQPANAKAYNNLAVIYQGQGCPDRVIPLLRQVVALEPDNEQAYQSLGIVLMAERQFAEARDCFRRLLTVNPQNPTAQHFHAALQGYNPDRPPPEYVAEVFDYYAPFFEKHLTGKLHYRVPTLLRATLTAEAGEEHRFANVVDLGCGTGLAGLAVRGVSARLTGIDLSARMIAQAREKGCYDHLCHGAISEVLDGLHERFDLFVAADVLIYLGDLRPLFASVGRRASGAAYFLFSIEEAAEGDFTLLPSGRYAHSRRYIEALADAGGWQVRQQRASVLRTEDEQDIAGVLYLLQLS